MHIIERHQSPDRLLSFTVKRADDGDYYLGFDGFPWHTHADILASISGLPEAAAVRRFVDALIGGRAIVAIARSGGRIRDVWVAESSAPDKHKPDDETIEFRYWDGRSAA
jgi:hypothetical protein